MRKAKLLLVLLTFLAGCSVYGPPQTPRLPVVNEYHGVKVVDTYQWLEDWDDQRVQTWSDEQNAYARKKLDNLPRVEELRDEAPAANGAAFSGCDALGSGAAV